MSCKASAEAFVESYASAMHLAQTSDVTTTSCANALAAHYHHGMTAFVFGHKTSFDTHSDAEIGVKAHLERFERAGLGYDIRLEKSRVEEISQSSALCWVTWKILPKNTVEGWQWENVYGYRKTQDGKEGWELVVSDNEIAGVMQKAPEVFASMMNTDTAK